MIRGTYPLELELDGIEDAVAARERIRAAQKDAAAIEDAEEREQKVDGLDEALQEAKDNREKAREAALSLYREALERETRLEERVEELRRRLMYGDADTCPVLDEEAREDDYVAELTEYREG